MSWPPYDQPAITPTDLHTDRAHPARIYDYVIGGKTHFAADRAAAEKMLQAWPALRSSMRANRAFMHRATRWLVRHGIHQLLDIGTGIPTSPNVHEVAQTLYPKARVVYSDNDPIVLAHARALLRGTPEGRVDYVQADMRLLPELLAAPSVRQTLDLTRPVGVLLLAVLQFVNEQQARDILRGLVQALPPKSYVAVTLPTADSAGAAADRVAGHYTEAGIPVVMRTAAQVADLLTRSGLDIAPPGIKLVHRWNPAPDANTAEADDAVVAMYGGVGLKP
ncbi:hypothetical protein BIV57_13260 [Mangrovactinospora gilvigrisea]|uniref:Methyltransferase n=1 Tax=Mangrovactinospora gilvigrisea TaxID=1428644 RepID=A0A1J7C5Z5_9ACTN|nr:SAM-dependent methyltransferase [Mangrovactinospora gilvigrisea]OIV36956.1 hypothetical protein BIV57_13260 [Mangrovactinospora gilvigrisea]